MQIYGAQVTDPTLLSQLNGTSSAVAPTQTPVPMTSSTAQAPTATNSSAPNYGAPVTDPNLLNQLNSGSDDNGSTNNQPTSLLGKWWNAIKIMNSDPYTLAKNVASSIPGMVNAAPSEVGGLINQVTSNPKRFGENLVTGVGEARNAVVNLPSDVLEYYAHLGLIDPKYAQSIRAIDNQTNMMPPNEPAQPGDVLAQAIPGLIPVAPTLARGIVAAGKPLVRPLVNATRSLVPYEADYAMAQQNAQAADEQLAASKTAAQSETGKSTVGALNYGVNQAQDKLLQNPETIGTQGEQQEQMPDLAPHQKVLQEAQDAHDQAVANLNSVKQDVQSQIGKSSPGAINYAIKNLQESLPSMTEEDKAVAAAKIPDLQQYEDALTQAQAEHDSAVENLNQVKTTIGRSTPEALANDFNKTQQQLSETPQVSVEDSKNNLDNVMSDHENAQSKLGAANDQQNNIDQQISQELNQNAAHSVRASRSFKDNITSINDYWSDNYKQLMSDLKGSNFQLDNPERVGAINSAIDNARATYGDDPTGEFAQLIKKAPTTADTTASDFMMKQKDFRDHRYNLLQRAKEEPSAVKRDELFRAYRDSEPIDKIISDTLEDGLGQYKDQYKWINQGYREQVFPLRENAVAQKAMNGEPLSANMASELSGYEPGQELMREIAKRDPEIRRNVVGQQYKTGKDKVLNPNETVREYTNQMPELNALTDQRRDSENRVATAANRVAETKSNLSNAQNEHNSNLKLSEKVQNLSTQLNQTKEKIGALENAIKSKNMSLERKIQAENELKNQKNMRDDLIKRQDQIGQAEQKSKKIASDIKLHQDNIDKLTSAINNTKMSALQKKIAQKELENQKRIQSDLMKKNKISKPNTINHQKINNDIRMYQRHIDQLTKDMNTKSMTDKELLKTKTELSKYRTLKNKAFTQMGWIGGIGGLYGAYKYLYLGKLLTASNAQGE